ncbi:MAG: hypothetical protein ACRDRJ_25905 [Streptosporangiaceae bacterium]
MSTNGFIIFIANSQSKNSYSHWDSGPRELGVKVLRWLRSSTSTPDGAPSLYQRIGRLQVVSDEDALPTEAQRRDLAVYFEQTGGGEWYSLLRATQGEPEKILECGYIADEGKPYGWQYVIDADSETFSVDCDWGNGKVTSWPWSDLPDDNALSALAEQYEAEAERYDKRAVRTRRR